MEIYIDGVLKASSTSGAAKTTSSISYAWNTKVKKVTSGSHIITVKAYDFTGNVGSGTITVVKP